MNNALRAVSTRKARGRPKPFVLTNQDQIVGRAKPAPAISSRHGYPHRLHRLALDLFASMSKNAVKASEFFQIPTNRVVELGTQVEL